MTVVTRLGASCRSTGAGRPMAVPGLGGRPLPAWLLLMVMHLTAGATAQAADDYLYTVQTGDNPWNLSERFLLDMSYWPRLVAHNHITDDRRLPPGSTLRIPRRWLRLSSSTVQIGALTGEVQVDHGQGQGWQAATAGTRLSAGARLKTEAQASAALQLSDGSQVLVRGDTELRLAQAGTVGNGALMLRIELQRGRLENAVHPLRASGGRFEIQTPSAITAVRGTDFRIAADAHSTRSEVLDGAVELGNPRGKVRLERATGSVATVQAPPQRPRPLLGAPRLGGIPTRWEQAAATLTWPALPGAQAYRVQLATLDGEGREDGTTLADRVSTTPSQALPPLRDGHYRLRVRAVDALGLEGLQADTTLLLDTQPAPPEPQAPRSLAPVTRQSGTLRWRPAAGPVETGAAPPPTQYRVQIAGPAGFAAALADLAASGLACALPDLTPGRYQWRIASVAGDDQGPWSAVQPLELAAGAPDLVGIDIDRQLRLHWRSEEHAPVRLQVARDPAFTQLLLDEPRYGQTAALPLPATGTYHLRVGSWPVAGHPVTWGAAHQVEVGRWHLTDSSLDVAARTDLNSLPPTGAGPAPTCLRFVPPPSRSDRPPPAVGRPDGPPP